MNFQMYNCKKCGRFARCNKYGLCVNCGEQFEDIIREALAGFIADWNELELEKEAKKDANDDK